MAISNSQRIALSATDFLEEETPVVQSLLQGTEFEPLPPRMLLSIPIERITISHEYTLNMRKIADLEASIKTLGVLQPPSLGFEHGTSVLDAQHPDAHFRVLCGRHRVSADKRVAASEGRETIECFVYLAIFSEALAASVSSTENLLRGEDWRYEVAAMKALILNREGLTEEVLGKCFGLRRPLVRQRLAIARLPDQLVKRIIENKKISLALAMRMSRLTIRKQQQLLDRVLGGEELSEDLIDVVWDEQVNGNLEQVAPTFLQVLNLPVDKNGHILDRTIHHDLEDETSHLSGNRSEQENPAALITRMLPLLEQLKRYPMPPRLSGLSEFYQQALQSWLHDLQNA